MSRPVMITADSTVDLSPALRERFGIHIIPLTIQLGDTSFPDDGNFTPADLYARFRKDGTLPKTASPGLQYFIDYFKSFTDAGYDVVHLSICSELSGAFNVARLAADELSGVYIIDSRMLSTGIGLLAIEAAECREKGMSAGEIVMHLEPLTSKVSTSFVLDSLEFMRKGGRCSGIKVLGANLLKIKPALEMRDGKLQICKKYRGKIEQVYRLYVTDRLAGKKVRPGHVFLVESGEIAPEVLEELEILIRNLSGCLELHHETAGCTISSHCGPKTFAVMFIEE